MGDGECFGIFFGEVMDGVETFVMMGSNNLEDCED